MIKFTKPKVGEIRYLAFSGSASGPMIYKVKMNYCGRTWYKGEILQHLEGIDLYSERTDTGELYGWCFVETFDDAKKLLIYGAFDTRDISLFYREKPDLEQIV